MEQPLNRIEDTYYKDKRRRQGIARLAIHSSFEQAMTKSDNGELSREDAITMARSASQAILSHMGLTEIRK